MKIFSKFIVTGLVISLLAPYAYGSEVMKSGEVLSEDSYVFSLEEIQELREQMSQLEKSIETKSQIIFELKKLDSNLNQQVIGLESVIGIKDLQVSEYSNLHDLDLSRIRSLERQNNLTKIERWVLFGAGVGVTVGSILIADKLNDTVGSNSFSSPNTLSSAPLLRF